MREETVRPSSLSCGIKLTLKAHTATPAPSKQKRTMNRDMEHFVVLETTGQKDNYKTELQKLYSAIDTELGEVDQHFRAQHTTHSFTCCFESSHH